MTQTPVQDPKTVADCLGGLAVRLQAAATSAGPARKNAEMDPASVHGQVEEVAHWARTDHSLHNDTALRACVSSAHATNDQCRRDKERSIGRMCGFVEAHPNKKLRQLSDFVDDPIQIGMEERWLVPLARGLKDPNKLSLVNSVLAMFAVKVCKLTVDLKSLVKLSKKRKGGWQMQTIFSFCSPQAHLLLPH